MLRNPETQKSSRAGKRRSDRVSLSFPIVVSGADIATGHAFVEDGRTLNISRTGGTIVLSRVLGPEQTIFIKCAATQKEAEARVVGQLGIALDSHIYGIAVLDPKVDLWGVHFPELSEAERALGRVCLQCITCGAREVCYLSEVELEVFDVNHNLGRSCTQCREWTLWKDVPQDFVEPVPAPTPETQSQPPSPEAQPAPARSEERRVGKECRL